MDIYRNEPNYTRLILQIATNKSTCRQKQNKGGQNKFSKSTIYIQPHVDVIPLPRPPSPVRTVRSAIVPKTYLPSPGPNEG